MISLCENHPLRIGCSVNLHDGWFEIYPENYLWEKRMGQTVEIRNLDGKAVYIKVDVGEHTAVEIPIREREGPWFCTNWYHKVYYRKFVPPGYTFLHRQNMKWYLPYSKKTKQKIFVTVIKADDDGTSTSRIARKELILSNVDLGKMGGFVIQIDHKGRIVPEMAGM
ncbi:unnamed protein product, partial [Mesorhabditis belari]